MIKKIRLQKNKLEMLSEKQQADMKKHGIAMLGFSRESGDVTSLLARTGKGWYTISAQRGMQLIIWKDFFTLTGE